MILHQVRHPGAAKHTEKVEVCSISWNLSGVNLDLLAAEGTAHFDQFPFTQQEKPPFIEKFYVNPPGGSKFSVKTGSRSNNRHFEKVSKKLRIYGKIKDGGQKQRKIVLGRSAVQHREVLFF